MHSRSGLTLLEVLIGVFIATGVALSAFWLLDRLFSEGSAQSGKQAAQTELDDLLTQLRRDWRARGPGDSYAAAAAPACDGLTITQPVADGKAPHTVTYTTSCAAGGVPANAPKVSLSASCAPGQRAEVTVTRTNASGTTNRRYTAANEVLSIAACFRVVPGSGVTAELAALSRKGRGAAHLRLPLYLSETDRSPSVQIYVK